MLPPPPTATVFLASINDAVYISEVFGVLFTRSWWFECDFGIEFEVLWFVVEGIAVEERDLVELCYPEAECERGDVAVVWHHGLFVSEGVSWEFEVEVPAPADEWT